MRSRLNFKTVCTTTMPPWFIDITHWDVSAVVLVLMLFTKWIPIRVLIAEKLNYSMTSLLHVGKNDVEVKFENRMHNYNATLVH